MNTSPIPRKVKGFEIQLDMSKENLCELCGARGVSSRLVPFQVNLEEAILLCENNECLHPLGNSRVGRFTVHRKAAEISNFKRKKKKKSHSTEHNVTAHSSDIKEMVKTPETFIQWQNADALCWLDCVLSILVHNRTIQHKAAAIQAPNSMLRLLLKRYQQALDSLSGDVSRAKEVLQEVRQEVWTYLKPKMSCKLGVNDSPVFALPLLLRENIVTHEHCLQEFTWHFNCEACGFADYSRQRKHLITFPNTPEDFSLPNGCFVKECNLCEAKNQKCRITYDKLPNIVLLHFVEGLKSAGYLDYQFDLFSRRYEVTQFIQYIHNPDHFICWTRQHHGIRWMELDDMKSPCCTWSSQPPAVPPPQVHILVCEPRPTALLVTRETHMEAAAEQNVVASEKTGTPGVAVSVDDADGSLCVDRYSDKDSILLHDSTKHSSCEQFSKLPSKNTFSSSQCNMPPNNHVKLTRNSNSLGQQHNKTVCLKAGKPNTDGHPKEFKSTFGCSLEQQKGGTSAQQDNVAVVDCLSSCDDIRRQQVIQVMHGSLDSVSTDNVLKTVSMQSSALQNSHSDKTPGPAHDVQTSDAVAVTMHAFKESMPRHSTAVQHWSMKRRLTTQFQPYVPKKQRQNSLQEAKCRRDNMYAKSPLDGPKCVSLWLGVAEQKGLVLDDSRSDSGYSSPSSVSSCCSSTSQPVDERSSQEYIGHDSDTTMVYEPDGSAIIAELEALLSESVLSQASPAPSPVDSESIGLPIKPLPPSTLDGAIGLPTKPLISSPLDGEALGIPTHALTNNQDEFLLSLVM